MKQQNCDVKLLCHGREITVEVIDLRQESEMSLAALLRDKCALQDDGLPPWAWEKETCDKPDGKRGIKTEFLKPIAAAREHALCSSHHV